MTVKVSAVAFPVGFHVTNAVTIPVDESIVIPEVRVSLTATDPNPVTVMVSMVNMKAPEPFVRAVVPPTALKAFDE